ncbi:formate/nitrite transporter family protein [Streptomyces sp. NPDC056653]|uniref:formate/nitrite transporter family protein n=1 Tax=Streptomyces sp. NPDC056653 TaxID=3345894 RepID=UPI0036749BB8
MLCNFLVCLGVWMAAPTRSDGVKIAMIFWALPAFVGSGFENVVANMTYYSLGMFEHVPNATAAEFARNLLLVGLGNLVGGSLLGVLRPTASWAAAGRRGPPTNPPPSKRRKRSTRLSVGQAGQAGLVPGVCSRSVVEGSSLSTWSWKVRRVSTVARRRAATRSTTALTAGSSSPRTN